MADGPSIGIYDAIRGCGPYVIRSFNRRGGRSFVGFSDLVWGIPPAVDFAVICLWLRTKDMAIVRTRGPTTPSRAYRTKAIDWSSIFIFVWGDLLR
jgi:hypothetical protein